MMGDAFILRRARQKAPLVLFDGTVASVLGGTKFIDQIQGGYYEYGVSSSKLRCLSKGTNYEPNYAYFGFNNAVSTNGYKYLHFTASCDYYAGNHRLGISSANTATFSKSEPLGTASSHTVTVDLTNHQGNYYLMFEVYGHGEPEVGALTSVMQISRIWLDNSETGS